MYDHLEKIGEYKVLELLGEGAFGKVFLVESALSDKYAAKVITINNRTRQSTRQEALMLLQISHKYIIKVREFFMFNQEKFFVIIMEYCPGGNLDDFIGETNQTKIQKVMREAAEGILYLHQTKIIHRDLKPENIFFGKDGEVKIGDLGLAKLVKSSLVNTKAGSPLYMANEICQSDNYGNEVDIWSLGLIFIELVIGQRIWTLLEGMDPPCKRAEFPTQRIKDAIQNKKWLDLILRMLAKEPKERINIQQVLNIINNKPEKQVLPFKYVAKQEVTEGKEYIQLDIKPQKEKEKQTQKQKQKVKLELKQKIRQFEEGSTYTGDLTEGQRQGKGIFVWKNGNKYEGQWKNDQQNGKGIKYFNVAPHKGDRYEGDWVDGTMEGRGICYFANGNKYQGEFKNNKRAGKGNFYFGNGDKYEGSWFDDKYNGKGVLQLASGNKYEGQFKDNDKTGTGVYYFSNGNRFHGQFVNNKRSGRGIFYFISGEKYDGQWFDDKYNGRGTLSLVNGNRYDGEFKDNVKIGKGIYYFSSGEKYQGQFKNDKINGRGVCSFPNGDMYQGEFKDQKRNGQGTFYYSNGNKYEGQWLYDQKSGKGIYSFVDGGKYQGEFKESKYCGKGIFYFGNGNKYEGDFVNDKRDGKGVFYFANGNKYDGQWKQDQYHGEGVMLRDGKKYKQSHEMGVLIQQKSKWF